MNCYKFRDSISQYIDNELIIKDINSFNLHIEECKSCRTTYLDIVNVIDSMKHVPPVAVSADFGDRLRSRIQREQARQLIHKRRIAPIQSLGLSPRYAVASVAAVVAILVISISFFTGNNGDVPILESTPTLFTREMDSKAVDLSPESFSPAESFATGRDSSSEKIPVVPGRPVIPEGQIKQVSGK